MLFFQEFYLIFSFLPVIDVFGLIFVRDFSFCWVTGRRGLGRGLFSFFLFFSFKFLLNLKSLLDNNFFLVFCVSFFSFFLLLMNPIQELLSFFFFFFCCDSFRIFIVWGLFYFQLLWLRNPLNPCCFIFQYSIFKILPILKEQLEGMFVFLSLYLTLLFSCPINL